jgi:glycosyltransferase involved in cell wall biosynthesis
LQQLGEDDELIVSDDGSTDSTLQVLDAFHDSRIKVFCGPRTGLTYNFENAIKNASGDYLFLSDQDDVWMPEKVSVTMKYLQQYDCVVSDNVIVDAEGSVIADSFYAINKTRPGKYYNLLIKNGYLGCCMAFRRCVLESALPFPSDAPDHDGWIGNVAAFKYSVRFIPAKLIHYNRHGGNASTTSAPSTYSLRQKLGFRWSVIHNLFLK